MLSNMPIAILFIRSIQIKLFLSGKYHFYPLILYMYCSLLQIDDVLPWLMVVSFVVFDEWGTQIFIVFQVNFCFLSLRWVSCSAEIETSRSIPHLRCVVVAKVIRPFRFFFRGFPYCNDNSWLTPQYYQLQSSVYQIIKMKKIHTFQRNVNKKFIQSMLCCYLYVFPTFRTICRYHASKNLLPRTPFIEPLFTSSYERKRCSMSP